MYKMHPDDIRARDIEFLVHGKLTPWPILKADDPWAMGHEFPCAQPAVLACARANFFNHWPPDGQPLDVEGLEAAFALAQQPRQSAFSSCRGCGTSLRGERTLCTPCTKEAARNYVRAAQTAAQRERAGVTLDDYGRTK